MIEKLERLRKELHQNPELSGQESKTAERLKLFLKDTRPTQLLENLGGHGIAFIYKFSSNGPTVAIRCELDALPIAEPNLFEYRSHNQGVSHKCGHDGHMAIVVGLALWLKDNPFKSGKIVLLFQPAEETGEGAAKVIADKRFRDLNIDYFFALHNIPGEPIHKVIVPKLGFSAEVISLAIALNGKESHASEPDKGINPALPMAELILQLDKLNFNSPDNQEFSILTPIHSRMGNKSYGISPANGELHYTIRTWTTENMELLKSRITEICAEVCARHSIDYTISWFEYFPASRNHPECVAQVLKAAEKASLAIHKRAYPFYFGEDFGWYSKKYKSAMFGLGAGLEAPPLHNASYDFPDELIPTGISLFQEIISGILEE